MKTSFLLFAVYKVIYFRLCSLKAFIAFCNRPHTIDSLQIHYIADVNCDQNKQVAKKNYVLCVSNAKYKFSVGKFKCIK